MKYIWEADDIKNGVYFARRDPKGRMDQHTLHKIGYLQIHTHDDHMDDYNRVGISMSDGCVLQHAGKYTDKTFDNFEVGNDQLFADALNIGSYCPIPHREVFETLLAANLATGKL